MGFPSSSFVLSPSLTYISDIVPQQIIGKRASNPSTLCGSFVRVPALSLVVLNIGQVHVVCCGGFCGGFYFIIYTIFL